jgi:hypothetical protein
MTTTAKGLRNCFLKQIKYKWLLPLKGSPTLAKPKFKNYWKIKIREIQKDQQKLLELFLKIT